MKIGIVGDIHWSTYSSILRSRGKFFSTRLEYLIKSLSWVESTFEKYDCEEEIFLGDFFDKSDLSSEEITALSEVEWNHSSRLKHFIVGNHESGISSLVYNSTQALHKIGVVEDVPYLYPLDDKTEILFLPYITEDNRKSLSEYLKNRDVNKKLIIVSHNDIKDFQMGMFLSKTGFSVDDIESNCELYINGHLHNGGWVTNKILNLGNLCGQNFNEDAFKYEHHIAILDTDTLKIEFIENPYALNFYNIEITNSNDLQQLQRLKNNSIISIRCNVKLKEQVLEYMNNLSTIVAHRFILTRDVDSVESEKISFEFVNHLNQFSDFILQRDDINIEIAKQELLEVCK